MINSLQCQNSCKSYSVIFTTATVAIVGIAIAIIGFTGSPQGPFNTISQLGSPFHGALLGVSIFVLILDLVVFKALRNKVMETINHEESAVLSVQASDQLNVYSIPRDVLQKIFSFLTPQALARCFRVSKAWQACAKSTQLWQAFDLKKISTQIRTFDEKDWAIFAPFDLGIDVTDALQLNKSVVIPLLFKILISHKIEGNAGVTLLTVPKHLNLAKLRILAESPSQGSSTFFVLNNFVSLSNLLERGCKSQPIAKTYHVVIANNIVKGTQGSFHINIRDKMEESHFPDVLSISTLAITTFISTNPPMRLFPDNPDTLVLCSDRHTNFRQTLVFAGSFGSNGFCAFSRITPIYQTENIGYGMQIKLTDEHYLPICAGGENLQIEHKGPK